MASTGILTNGLMSAAYLLGSPAHEEPAGCWTTANTQLHMEHLELMASLLRATLWRLSVENCVGLADDWTCQTAP